MPNVPWWERTWFSIVERCDRFSAEEVTLTYEDIHTMREVAVEFAKLRSFKEDMDDITQEYAD